MRGSKTVENMRAALVDLLSKGGKKFQEFDDAYAAAVRDRMMIPEGDPRASSPIGIARNMAGAFGGAPVTHGPAAVVLRDGTERMPQGVLENVVSYGIPATGAAVRYALPVAGVSLAGRGLMDLVGGTEDDGDTLMITLAR